MSAARRLDLFVAASLIVPLCIATPAVSATLLCEPVALAEVNGEPGPLTIWAADPMLGHPVLFWVDLETGHYEEHFDEGDTFITGKGRFEILDPGTAENALFLAHDQTREELVHIDLRYGVHPFYTTLEGALSQIGSCVSAPMGVLPADPLDAPTLPFPYGSGGKVK